MAYLVVECVQLLVIARVGAFNQFFKFLGRVGVSSFAVRTSREKMVTKLAHYWLID